MKDKNNVMDIAIIGMAIKIPQANSLQQFWNIIVNQIDTVKMLPAKRRHWLNRYINTIPCNHRDKIVCPEGAYIENIEEFDNELFHITPKESELLDPNQRIFLQVAFKALEDAGYPLATVKNTNTGVYVGFGDDSDYYTLVQDLQNQFSDIAKTGNLRPVIASRLSYIWDLKGPNMMIDTSCSSALTAIHVAAKALRSGECDMALSGGIKLSVLPNKNNSNIGVESPTYKTKPFDNGADGTTWGEGVGVVVLKRLEDAKKDNDRIYGIIKSSNVNQDGKSAGITAPSQKAQEKLIVNTWKDSLINPEEICYIETHGTGTILGDPIELEGLTRAFNHFTKKKQFCAIGSVKANVGHTVHASGVIGLIKVLLSIQHKIIPPMTNFNIANQNITFENSALFVPTNTIHVKNKMICGISSFGVSGTNVHMLIEEAEPKRIHTISKYAGSNYYLALSVRREDDYKKLQDEYVAFLNKNTDITSEEICYSALYRKNHYNLRSVINFSNIKELINILEEGPKHRKWIFSDSSLEELGELPDFYKCFLAGTDINSFIEPKTNDIRYVKLPGTIFHNKNYWLEIPKSFRVSSELYHIERTQPETTNKLELTGKKDAIYTETEREVANILQVLIGVDKIDVSQNFGELGTDSILLTKFVSEINKKLNLNLKVSDLFANPTIKSLSKFIDSKTLLISVNDETEEKDSQSDDIAIVGISARLPRANNIFEFWDNLIHGRDCKGLLERKRKYECEKYLKFIGDLHEDDFFSEGGYIDDYNCFDYKFFNITPKEAELMDPHQRVVLEEAWKAIIDAGYTEESIYGTNTGVYIGYTNDFRFNYWKMVNDIEPLSYSMAVAPNLSSIIPSRLSYVFNLKGPSMLIDTACSSSLVAIHTACEELKNNICDMAITGGARINLMPVSNKNRNIGIESPDFSLYAFDENANGTVWGEGVVIFVLRRLKDAQKNNEHIYGIIKGSATNQDGMSAGITAPNPQAQIDVLRKAWENAKIRPEDMAYIECHGTGTNMGDPIEVDSIDKAFQKYTNKKQFCGIGSVKSMIGHLDAVSGAAGLLKILLSMQYGQLPGNINLRIPNNAITFEDSPVYYLKENQKWEKEGRKRIAGVSAFGFSGTNCHMVIEAKDSDFHSNINYREQEYLFVLSAKTQNALWNLLYEYNNFLQFNITPPLINICYTLCKARPHYDERIAFVVKNLSELKQEISCFIRNGKNLFESEREKLKNIYINTFSYMHNMAVSFMEGQIPNWDELYIDKFEIVSLPTYSFEKTPCWLTIPRGSNEKENVQRCVNHNTLGGDIENIILLGRDGNSFSNIEKEVALVWKKVLGFTEININSDFYEMGGHSIAMMEIVNSLQDKYSVSLTYSEFNDNCTISKLAKIVESKKGENAIVQYPQIVPDKRTLYDEFMLTDIQMAYLLGRKESFEMGGVCTHVYLEVVTKLDIARLERSLNKVIARHPMLHAIVNNNGKQKILQEIPYYHINIRDLSMSNKNQQEDAIKKERKVISHHVFQTGEWPMIGVSALKLEENSYYLFIEFDMLIADGSSLQIIGNDWMTFYDNENIQLPELNFTFKDYMKGLMELKSSDLYRKDKDFWLKRLDTFPDAPSIPYVCEPELITKPHFNRLTATFDRKKWGIIKNTAQNLKVSTSALLCAAYAEVLAYWSNQPHMAINLTVFNRYPFNEEVNFLVGDFTSVMLVEIDFTTSDIFEERVKSIQKEIMKNLEHRHYDGVEFIRELARKKNRIGEPIMPFVFTSMLFNDADNPWDKLGKTIMGLSQTPQVYLDHQAGEMGGELVINWDYVSEIFDQDMINSMFKQYTDVLEFFAEGQE